MPGVSLPFLVYYATILMEKARGSHTARICRRLLRSLIERSIVVSVMTVLAPILLDTLVWQIMGEMVLCRC